MSGKSDKTTPIVSILTPSFNHEKYVGFFIDSLLAQTNPNWELVIVDDCSSDKNVAEIKKYSDPRIKLIKHEYNKGINAAINTAFEASLGQYISLIASDDMLDQNYVKDIKDTISGNKDIDVIYYSLQGINTENEIVPDKILKTKYTDKYQALKHSFYKGNCFVSPGMCIRRESFKNLYPLNLALSQNQDYKIHVDLLLKGNMCVSEKALIKYRLPSEKSGVSFQSPRTLKQRELEENLLMDSFLRIDNIELLKNIFKEDLKPYGEISKDIIPYVLGMLALNSTKEYKKIWGYNQISKFLSYKENYDKLNKQYGFCFKDFLNIANKLVGSDLASKFEKKSRKYKNLFNVVLVINLLLIALIFFFICF